MTVDEGAGDGEETLVSSRTTGIADGPGSDTGGDSSTGVDKMGEVIGIDGKLLDFVGDSISVKEAGESGDLLAFNEREMLLGFPDDSEVAEGSGAKSSVIASSAIGPAGGSELPIRIEGEPELVDLVDLVWLKLPFREC